MDYDYVIIEDNKDDIELMVEVIDSLKTNLVYHLIKDGDEADSFVDMLISSDLHHPRLILLDLKLPKSSGYVVLEKIKNNEKIRHIPIVVFTSSQKNEDMYKSYSLGANAFVVKPIEFDEFEEAMKGIGQFWLIHNYCI